MSFNRVVLMGRLTAAPEMKSTGEGTEYCKFTIAVDRSFSKKGEEKQADFINCTAWRQTAAFVGKYFNKGSMILVEGSWRHEKYLKDDETRYSDYCQVENVSFCGGKNESGSAPSEPKADTTVEVDPDDLPF